MGVNIFSRVDIGVAQESPREFEVAGQGVDEAPSQMPESVEPRRARLARDAEPVQDRIQDILPQHIGVQW